MDQQKLLLDQFFGVDRNLSKSERNKKKERYSDKEVCPYYLVSSDTCYKELFPNTPYDDGPCKQRHDEFFKRQFEDDPQEKRAEHEYVITKQVIDYLQKKVDDVDHKIIKNRAQNEKKPNADIERPKEVQDKIDYYENQIKQLLEQSKQLGAQGEIEQSERLSDQAESLRAQKDGLINLHENGPMSNREAQKEVCEVCGAWKITNDNDKRAVIHLEGKIHQGFAILRSELARLLEKKAALKILLKKMDKEREKRRKSKSKDKKRKSQSPGKLRKEKSRERSNSKGRGNIQDRRDKGDRNDRDRGDRNDRNRGDRNDRDRGDRNDRDRGDRNDRDRGDRGDRRGERR